MLAVVTAACTAIPATDGLPPTTGGTPPQLLPLDALIAQGAVPAGQPVTGLLAARAARLKARAALMRGPVHDPATRARLAAAISDGRA